jgi:hypothetical protein
MFLEIEDEFLTYTAEFDFKRGGKDQFDTKFGQWLPGDAPSVKLRHVWVRCSNESIDVLPALDGTSKGRFESRILETMENEE